MQKQTNKQKTQIISGTLFFFLTTYTHVIFILFKPENLTSQVSIFMLGFNWEKNNLLSFVKKKKREEANSKCQGHHQRQEL
jgi:hypothetical protein